ncbi:hypothetical protein R6Q57_003909 [Mikania cordata]
MGHRHVFSPSYMFETNNDEGWNLIECPYALTAETGGAESSSLAYPTNNMSVDGEQCSNPAPVSNVYSSLAHNVQNLHYQQDTSGPSNLSTGHEIYGNVASSSNYNGCPIHEDDNGKWQYKHKSPADTNKYNSHESNPFLTESSSAGENDIITNGNHVQSTQVQSVRGTRRNYIQRSSGLQLGHLNEGLLLATESYSSPHIRPTIALRSSDRNVRARISIEGYQSFYEEANFHDQPMHEGLMIVNRSAFGSRNPFDYHRDMRLDIDDMSYEELLALGERIGSVSTGLSENLISKCLRESIYCSSDQGHDEGRCVICLEEYANMDNVGMLKGCKHDFHVGCIKKWLSMKNLCPICKSEPIKQK